jgi:hypothetical protein
LKLSTARVDGLIWLLIYGGLLGLALGLALRHEGVALGWSVVVAGSAATLVGVVLVWVRSRMTEPPPR